MEVSMSLEAEISLFQDNSYSVQNFATVSEVTCGLLPFDCPASGSYKSSSIGSMRSTEH